MNDAAAATSPRTTDEDAIRRSQRVGGTGATRSSCVRASSSKHVFVAGVVLLALVLVAQLRAETDTEARPRVPSTEPQRLNGDGGDTWAGRSASTSASASGTAVATLPRFDPSQLGVTPRDRFPLPAEYYSSGIDLSRPEPRQLVVTLVDEARTRVVGGGRTTTTSVTVNVLLTWTTGPVAKQSVVRYWRTNVVALPEAPTPDGTLEAAATDAATMMTARGMPHGPVLFTGTGEVGHRVQLSNLAPSTRYTYVVGDDELGVWSGEHSFLSPPSPTYNAAAAAGDGNAATAAHADGSGPDSIYPFRVLMYGDQEFDAPSRAVSLAAARDITASSGIDYGLAIHVGDAGYPRVYGGTNLTMQTQLLEHWFRQQAGITASVPFIVTPGNHDMLQPAEHEGWSDECAVVFLQLLRMPGFPSEPDPATQTGDPRRECPYPPSVPSPATSAASSAASWAAAMGTKTKAGRFWYSVNYGPLHVVALSSEHDYAPGSAQHAWLARDLAAASAPPARAARPWIVVFLHRPLYCTHNFVGCADDAPNVRAALEPLLLEAKVDLVVAGHVHAYERTHPVAHGARVGVSTLRPRAPIYLVVGASGAADTDEGYPERMSPLTAARSGPYGFVRLTVENATAMRGEFVGVDVVSGEVAGILDEWRHVTAGS